MFGGACGAGARRTGARQFGRVSEGVRVENLIQDPASPAGGIRRRTSEAQY